MTNLPNFLYKKHKVPNCYIRLCNPEDYQEILDIQNVIMADLKSNKNERLFIPTQNNQIKDFLNRKDIYFLCVQTPEGICAYSYTFFSSEVEFDLSYNFEQNKVATFDTVVVLPNWRGNKLHEHLLNISIEEAKKRDYDLMAATVDPENIYSINNFVANGFEILKNAKDAQYEGYERYIVYKKL
ncbi:GNAT family N-acetyltransferase [Bacteroides sp. 519]|uniref:GNAT family N-acetyltransferase n=1 Tax=Bacteroides sp. 519 TaxID=2302937 RepID=UPI0013D523E1|nr:GNAT family N-acetyltransferase [Bacteroides sp. 519]NDV59261.1 GNAT family N-acetyltransferase [Bacteroides sp. 519]